MSEFKLNKSKELEEEEDTGQYLLLPIANVSRAIKDVVPEKAKVSKEAKRCIQECVSEFIFFVTSEAADKCRIEKRRTINGEDVVWAVNSLGFTNFTCVLRIYLLKLKDKKWKDLKEVSSGYLRTLKVTHKIGR